MLGMGIRRRGACLPGFRKLQQKQVVFSVLTGKKQILPLWPHLQKFFTNSLVTLLEKIFPAPMLGLPLRLGLPFTFTTFLPKPTCTLVVRYCHVTSGG